MPPTAMPQDHKSKAKRDRSTKMEQRVETEAPSEGKYAPTAWGSQIGGAEDLTTPSGQTCLVKRPGVQGLMEAGVIRDMDSLSALVDEKHIKRVNGRPTGEVNVQSLTGDTEGLKNIMHVVDRVVCEVVVQPPVSMAPNDPTSRKQGVVYTDMIDIMDKMFIFQFAVGGTRGLETFREQFESVVGNVGPLETTG